MSCKPQIFRYFTQGRCTAVQLQVAPDAIEDTLLVGGEAGLVHGANVRTLVRMRKSPVCRGAWWLGEGFRLRSAGAEGELSLPPRRGGGVSRRPGKGQRGVAGCGGARRSRATSKAAPFTPPGSFPRFAGEAKA